MSSILGLCDKTQLTIWVWEDQAPAKVWSTLWHEVKHAMFEESGINLKEDEEEDIVGHLERIEFSVFRDNPQFMRNMIKAACG